MLTLTAVPEELMVLQDDDPVLRQVSQPVASIDIDELFLVDKMREIVERRAALGLAAIQLGIPLRLIVVRLERGLVTMVNPVITRRLNRFAAAREGCLSVPSRKWRNVDRPAKCEVTWQGLDGQTHSGGFAGMDARVIQHECDHLDGVLITDHPASVA